MNKKYNLSISNIAWDKKYDEQVASLLNNYDIKLIDIAISRYFSDLENISIDDLSSLKEWWKKRNIRIYGCQSLLYGKKNLNLFSNNLERDELLIYLEKVFKIAKLLGAEILVFGSPKNRQIKKQSLNDAFDIACSFFHKVSEIALKHDLIICLEPNPQCYNCNFMINSQDTAAVVKAVNHKSLKMQFDTGAIIINEEDPYIIYKNYKSIIGHIHLSEPWLVPLGTNKNIHKKFFEVMPLLDKYNLTIEMLLKSEERFLDKIEESIKVAIFDYCRY